MRIALNAWFIDRPATGSGQYLVRLLAQYAARPAGHRFLLCGHAGQHPPDFVNADSTCFEWQTLHTPFGRGVSATPHRPLSTLQRHLIKLWFEQVSFSRACRRWGADLIHVPYWGSPLHCSVPIVVTIHDLIPVLLPAYAGGVLGRLYVRLVTVSARRASYVLTDSHASRHDIVSCLNIPSRRVTAIHLAAGKHFLPVSDPYAVEKVSAKYELPARYLLYLGGFDVRKNVENILRAYARLDLPDVRLVLAGKLPVCDTIFTPHPGRIAEELGLSARVHLIGWVDEQDKPVLYSLATAFVFPSRYEGFGLPPLEAMSCGTPVIVSDRGSLLEVVGPGGLSVDPDDIDALSAAMRSIVTDSALYERLRAAALTQAARYDWDKTARATMAAYRRTNSKGNLKGALH